MTYVRPPIIPDPVLLRSVHPMHVGQNVRCIHETPSLIRGDIYIIEKIVHDPQGDMVKLLGGGTYWLWRFAP